MKEKNKIILFFLLIVVNLILLIFFYFHNYGITNYTLSFSIIWFIINIVLLSKFIGD
jgi:hypothetical protein